MAAASATTTAATGAATAYPLTIKAANGDVKIAAKPTQIVSLSPTATEMLFAIGAGDQVMAVDDQSNYPAEAAAKRPTCPASRRTSKRSPATNPTSWSSPTTPTSSPAQLETLGIDVLGGPSAATLDDTYDQIEQLGALTGHVGEAAELVRPDADRHRRDRRRRLRARDSR